MEKAVDATIRQVDRKRVPTDPEMTREGRAGVFVRNKWLYMLGTGCSSFGDGLQSVAASWFLLQWTGSPLAIGGMIAVTYLPPLLLAPYVDLYLGGSSLSYAILDISFTVGGVLSGLIVGRMLQRYGPNVVIASLLGMGVLSGLAGIRASFLQVALSMFGLGFFVMFHLVTMQTLIQVNTPKELMGSVVGLRSIVASLTKIGAALGTGFAVSHFDITYVFWGFTAIILLTLLTAGKVRTLPIPESLHTPSNTKAAGG